MKKAKAKQKRRNPSLQTVKRKGGKQGEKTILKYPNDTNNKKKNWNTSTHHRDIYTPSSCVPVRNRFSIESESALKKKKKATKRPRRKNMIEKYTIRVCVTVKSKKDSE